MFPDIKDNNALVVSASPKKKSAQIKTEIWEVLTVLTIILSVASSLIWIKKYEPIKEKEDFLILDSKKSQIYNSYKKITNLPKKIEKGGETQPNVLGVSTKLQKTSINQEEYNGLLKSIYGAEDEVKNVRKNYTIQTDLYQNSQIENLLKSYEDYLKSYQNYYDQSYKTAGKILEIQKSVYEIATNKMPISISEIESLSLKIKDIKENLLIDKNWLKNLTDLEDKLQKVNQQKSLSSNDISDLKDKYLKVFTLPVQNDQMLVELKLYEEKFIDQLKNFQTWQSKYQAKNKMEDVNITNVNEIMASYSAG